MERILAPSILAADFRYLEPQMKATEDNGAKYLHFDVMDGIFVPSISFGMPVLKSIRKATGQFFDVHLMITEPIRYVKEFAEAGADLITVHLEACEDPAETIRCIRENGCRTGLSIKPQTPPEAVYPYLKDLDLVLVMSVEPGFGGQKFIPESLEKIAVIRSEIENAQLDIDIEVDGGIYTTNVAEVLEAGANVIVAGSAIFGGDAAENTRAMMEILRRYE